jgi:hypothetical protein
MLTCASLLAITIAASCGPVGQGQRELDSRIPPLARAMYEDIRDGKDWLNPKITIRAEGVEVESSAIPEGRRTVPVSELHDLLVALPTTAWPYGRVVVASDIGIRRGDRSDDGPIRRNHEAAQEILDGLAVRVEWWPS